jgi:phenylacetate-CoA ligase
MHYTQTRIYLLDTLRNLRQGEIFKYLLQNQYCLDKTNIILKQKEEFKKIFEYHYNNNCEYKKYLETNNWVWKEKYSIHEIPLMNKELLRKSSKLILEKNVHIKKHSGGTTGIPLSYSLDRESSSYLWPNIWRAFNVLNIEPCEKIIMFAGPSLYNKKTIKRIFYDLISNFHVVSAFDLTDEIFYETYQYIKSQKIRGIYGYTSAVYAFLQFLLNNRYYLNLKGIFTTSENFIPKIREIAKEYCNCDVIDIYGANDGGILAFECQYHVGYHIDVERCMLEMVEKKIVLTDLKNTATPFIRYEVGDLSEDNEIITEKCSCGRTLFRIKGISGRINNYIEDINGNRVHTEFFSHLFCGNKSINQYQIKEYHNEIVVNIVHDSNIFEQKEISFYLEKIKKRFEKKVRFVLNEPIVKLGNLKTPLLIKYL